MGEGGPWARRRPLRGGGCWARCPRRPRRRRRHAGSAGGSVRWIGVGVAAAAWWVGPCCCCSCCCWRRLASGAACGPYARGGPGVACCSCLPGGWDGWGVVWVRGIGRRLVKAREGGTHAPALACCLRASDSGAAYNSGQRSKLCAPLPCCGAGPDLSDCDAAAAPWPVDRTCACGRVRLGETPLKQFDISTRAPVPRSADRIIGVSD